MRANSRLEDGGEEIEQPEWRPELIIIELKY